MCLVPVRVLILVRTLVILLVLMGLHPDGYKFNLRPRAVDRRLQIDITQSEIRNPKTEIRKRGWLGQVANFTASPTDAVGALRIYTSARGLYRLTYDDLLTAGVPVATANSVTFAMSYLGQPIAIQVTGEGDGHFDPGDLVIFYAEPYRGRYMNRNVYWFTYGGSPGARMVTRAVTPTGGEPVITTITQTLHVEFDRDYRSTYPRPQNVDHWFDNPLYVHEDAPTAAATYTLALDDPLMTGDAVLRALLHGGADQAANPDQSVMIRLNGHVIGTFQWEGSTDYTATATIPAGWLPAPVRVDGAHDQMVLEAALAQLPGLGYYWVSPDWVEVSYPALADAEGDRIYIEGIAPGAPVPARVNEVVVAGFSEPAVRVYDVRDGRYPVQLTTVQARPDGESYTVHFWDVELPNPSYYLSTEAALLAPDAIEADTPSDWRSSAHSADYIAIIHRSLWDAIQPLLDHRSAEGLRVAKVDVQDIYDEFGFGRVDPEAIRSFLAYAYHNWNGGEAPPEYVLLVGDGHYDFTGVSGTSLPNLIPPYLIHVDPWLGETAADNRYVSVDGPDDYLPDMHVGRIPARDAADVTAVVSKIIAYETTAPAGDWQRRVVFVADDCANPDGNFHTLSDEARLNGLPAAYDARTIYYGNPTVCPGSDYSTANDMRNAIKGAFNDGALLMQWFGHASRFRWGSVSMFNILDPPNLVANSVWPLTFTYACWSGYFINLINDWQTLGETLLITPQRGSVADLSPSGLHLGQALVVLNQGIIRAIFQERIDRLGRAVDAGKVYYFGHSSAWHDVIDSSVLFGDPALHLRLPAVPGRFQRWLPLIIRGDPHRHQVNGYLLPERGGVEGFPLHKN